MENGLSNELHHPVNKIRLTVIRKCFKCYEVQAHGVKKLLWKETSITSNLYRKYFGSLCWVSSKMTLVTRQTWNNARDHQKIEKTENKDTSGAYKDNQWLYCRSNITTWKMSMITKEDSLTTTGQWSSGNITTWKMSKITKENSLTTKEQWRSGNIATWKMSKIIKKDSMTTSW